MPSKDDDLAELMRNPLGDPPMKLPELPPIPLREVSRKEIEEQAGPPMVVSNDPPIFCSFRPLPPGQRRRSRRMWLDALGDDSATSTAIMLSCSKRSASFGFSIRQATRTRMCLLNTRTREIVRIVRRGPVVDIPGRRELLACAWIDRAVNKAIAMDGQTIRRGDEWIILGRDDHVFATWPF